MVLKSDLSSFVKVSKVCNIDSERILQGKEKCGLGHGGTLAINMTPSTVLFL